MKFQHLFLKQNFYTIKPDETIADLAKKVQLEDGEEFHYAIQLPPDEKGNSGFIRLVDEGVQGSFVRPADGSISKEQKVPYRLFRAPDISDLPDERNSAYFVTHRRFSKT